MRLIDADELGAKMCEQCEEFPKCKDDGQFCEHMRMIEEMPFYTSLENYIEEHGEEIDFMFFAPELEQDGEDDI